MAKIYKVKIPPTTVLEYFNMVYHNTPEVSYDFKFYWYTGSKGEKVYGCEVYKNGEYWSNATQATVEDYEFMMNIPF